MKKGFTLIELLAVIVILAVIAIIAVPIIINIIDDARRNAAVRSADGYVRAVNYKVADLILNNEEGVDGEYTIGQNSLVLTGNNLDGITGMYTINNNRVIWAGLCVNNYSVEYSSLKGSAFATEIDYCDYEEPFVFVEPDGVLMSEVYADETKYSNTYFKIKTVEDLVSFSSLVNGGKNFADKTIYLLNDLDFEDTKSYTDSTVTTYGDINGNSTVEGLLTELTTGKGFKPIGTESNPFSGEFYGYAFTINHLMINRSGEYNAGLFGYVLGRTSGNYGTVNGIRIRNAVVTANGGVGAIAGINKGGKIKNVDVQATITGLSSDNSGGIVGRNDYIRNNGWNYKSTIKDFVFKGTVLGHNLLGGVAGSNAISDNEIKGLVYDTEVRITSTNSTKGRVTTGYGYTGSVMVSSTTTGGSDGVEYTTGSLSIFDKVIDTVIGGDTDGDHYYFDYDSNGEISLLTTDRNPIRSFKQSGTDESPYIISNINEWNRAAASIDPSEPHYYTLTNDLDFTGKELYPMGTIDNPFNGTFLGNYHTISNAVISGYNNVGVFGYNTGTIKDLNFNNITVTADNTTAGIFGYNDGGKILGVKARNITVTANGNAGGLIGYNTSGTNNADSVVKNVDVQATVTGRSSDNTGGIIGQNHYKYINGWRIRNQVTDFIFKGTVLGHNVIGGFAGTNAVSENIAKGLVVDSEIRITTSNSTAAKVTNGYNPTGTGNDAIGLVMVSSTTTKNTGSGNDGTSYSTGSMLIYDKVLDTIIGGDNDKDGYYFDFNSNGDIEMYSTTERPIPTLTGTGASDDPYIITNVSDWRSAVATIDQENPYYYSLSSDLDFTGANFYPMGTTANKFNGTFLGNHHTISNVTINGYDNSGLFGYNSSTANVKDINFSNITVTGDNTTAGIFGVNDGGKINGVKARNITVTANGNVGGLIGTNNPGWNNSDCVVKNIDVQATVTGRSSDNTGGIVGYNNYRRSNGWTIHSEVSDFVFKGTVQGHNILGGFTGYNVTSDNIVKGVIYNSQINITTSNSQVGKSHTGYNPSGTILVSSSTTKTPSGGSGNDGTQFTDITLSAVSSAIDTTDSNSDGYLFTLNNGEYELVYSNYR